MRLLAPLAAAVALAFAAGAQAKDEKGFGDLDRNNDGYVTRAEAAGNKRVLDGFDVADKNADGKLSRTEYLATTARQKLRGVVDKPENPDPGFNTLDKNDDGAISKAEADGNPHVKKFFKQADRNNDGKLTRAEYLALMAKKDVKSGAAKVEHGASSGR